MFVCLNVIIINQNSYIFSGQENVSCLFQPYNCFFMLWIKDEEKMAQNFSQKTTITKIENCTSDGNQSLNNVKKLLTTSDAV